MLGANTDAAGLARWMRLSEIDPSGKSALVLGAGGAARSAVWALDELGASSIVVLNRTPDRARLLVEALQPHLQQARLRNGDLHGAVVPPDQPYRVIINATSLGHHGPAPELDRGCYSRDSVAIELVYNPPLTDFMVAARAAGARTENGLGMLLHQAALAFERWTGQSPPIEVYEAVIRERVTA